jgi:D-threo-aldose 1-dehydrogenase
MSNTPALVHDIVLPNGRMTANLAFGCAGLLRLLTMRSREALLRTALDEGVTHFDTARMYGDGLAEGIVGRALGKNREQITFATKFGYPFVPAAGTGLSVRSLARFAFNAFPQIKSTMRRIASLRHKHAPEVLVPMPGGDRDFSPEEMQRSLGQSLEELQTDGVDLFFLHAPGLRHAIQERLASMLQDEIGDGRIGAFGISTGIADAAGLLSTQPEICGQAIQCEPSVLRDEPSAAIMAHPFVGFFRVIEENISPLQHYLKAHPALLKEWSARLRVNLATRENAGIALLGMALASNPCGTVVFFTSDAARLKRVVRKLRSDTLIPETLLEFRQFLIHNFHAC